MIARKGKLAHPALAVSLNLPLLIPSFTSKGFSYEMRGERRQYEVAGDVSDFPSRAAESILVSAYDLHFQHLDLERVDKSVQTADNALKAAEIVVLDSGGYELDSHMDSCEPRTALHSPPDARFTEQDYRKIVGGLAADPKMPPLCIASFDHGYKGKSVEEQIASAKGLFVDYPNSISSFILKPATPTDQYVNIAALSPKQMSSMRSFNVIGATADELGKDLKTRLQQIARLRTALNEQGIDAPIHVWGGLDPVVTPLYCFAGAELFDGVSWLRYAFQNGVAVNRKSIQVLSPKVTRPTIR
ncbi:MAG: hypothetical protein J0L78_16870 [Planctomycetes bacterium]|nr:hypothetical protein [Planctomycetota bacterium]